MPEVNGRWVADMKAPRTPDNEEPAAERAHDFRPVDKGFTEEMAVAEAARCMRCKKPLCVQGCPVNINIPAFIEKIYEHKFGEGLDVIHEQSMLPAICGRVCPQETQCEGKCIRGIKSEPVAIGQLERFLGDQPELASKPQMKPANGKKIAVIGSGPSGITCAGELARNGFDVTVFEAFFTGGGVLVYGIPEFRLPKAVVKREIDGLKELGVKFEYNSVMGNLADSAELLGEKGFDAIYVATGAGLPKFLNIPGENLPNVFFANEYLTRVNLMKANKFPEYDTPTKHGKHVVVFGGGNVAMDSVRTALRLGAEEVTLCYRRTEAEMPARRAEVLHAKAEGVKIHELVSPLEFIAGEDGAVRAVKVQDMELGEPDASGRRRPVPIEGAIEEIPCDVAISAIGTNANPFAAKIGGMELNKWGYIVADEETGRTSNPKIWAGGDIVTGAATVILAMGAGKKAAADMTKVLLGEDGE
ncbi:NADPH-dependent glutamate synthase [Parafannyhessea umbonata]|uniref:NADPH-dependent glutamate synthase n=1 Tax=Parafannyhessea umbonata TaxID=604330 RepID=A0A6N7WVD6_9ACTN|nr:NADPH-dependent glutamate synthase [Parafannyhessea umbonata]MST60738.1 NADPH-dependent glutamate synthase [Parafannyhessea umbonata]